MRFRRSSTHASAIAAMCAAVAIVLGLLSAPAYAAPDPSGGPAIDAQQVRQGLEALGSRSLRDIAASHEGERAVVLTAGPEFPGPKRPNAVPDTRVAPAQAPNPAVTPVAGPEQGMLGFGGLTHADSRFANNGNQFSG